MHIIVFKFRLERESLKITRYIALSSIVGSSALRYTHHPWSQPKSATALCDHYRRVGNESRPKLDNIRN